MQLLTLFSVNAEVILSNAGHHLPSSKSTVHTKSYEYDDVDIKRIDNICLTSHQPLVQTPAVQFHHAQHNCKKRCQYTGN